MPVYLGLYVGPLVCTGAGNWSMERENNPRVRTAVDCGDLA